MNEDFDYCRNLVKEFVDKKLSGELDNLKEFNFWELYNGKENISILLDGKKRVSFSSSEKKEFGCYADTAYRFDPDNSKIMNAIYYLLYVEKINDLRLSDIGTGQKYRGDTINTYGTLFSSKSLLVPDFFKDKKLQNAVNDFKKKYLSIGNFYMLPNCSANIAGYRRKYSLNTFRGVCGWNDYFDLFLNELKKYYNTKEQCDGRMLNIINENSSYFEEIYSFEKFCEINLLSPKISFSEHISYRNNSNDDGYESFAKEYIKTATDYITERADEIIKKLRPLMEC